MPRAYTVATNATNTASTTVPVFSVMATAAVRPAVYDLVIGSDATPADNAGKYVIERVTAAGTSSGTLTPNPIDAGDPAATSTVPNAWSVNPTLGVTVFQCAVNQRATFRWVAAPGRELISAAGTANGLALLCTANGGSAVNIVYSLEFVE